MGDVTTLEWLAQAIARLPRNLHSTARSVARTMDRRRVEAGEPYIDHMGLLTWLSIESEDDDVLAGMSRLVTLGWIEHDGSRFTLGPVDSPAAGAGRRRGITPRSRGHISRKRRSAIYVRDGWTCWLCGLQASVPTTEGTSGDWDAVIDHVMPHCLGGSDDPSNLRTAHNWCNSVRGERPAPIKAIQQARVIDRHAGQYADYVCGYSSVEPPEITLPRRH